MVGPYLKNETELTLLCCPKKKAETLMRRGAWERYMSYTCWLCGLQQCMGNRLCCIYVHGTVMNECKTHASELQLCKCWTRLHRAAWLRVWVCVCVCQRQCFLLLFNSESCFKPSQQSLQPSHTIPHTPHAASWSCTMTNGVCLTHSQPPCPI